MDARSRRVADATTVGKAASAACFAPAPLASAAGSASFPAAVPAGARTLQFRLMVSAVDRGVEVATKLVVPRREDESMEHVVLRVLAYCLYCQDGRGGALRLAPGPADRDGPDLWSHHPEGRADDWIICGAPDIEDLRYVLQHQRQAHIRVVLGSPAERDHLFAGLRTFRRTLPGLEKVDIREIDHALLARLARQDQERQRWMVTVVEDHVYVDADGVAVDGEVRAISAASLADAVGTAGELPA